ncbi:nucleotidyltransferase family protein [Shewanella zhangzhouensis]|uniref:nucleotidyltransferase family protein n=1 Tax=Shewanella zhangzhouensis TaxID=2864213 RepID=UPI001C6607DD|nr:nucleotidyltransferase family protein [Shewanella zhangzhouensis]QYK05062.1 nucleotidyltransferase family protein [Shewanella zhangzhouensis]
MKLLPVLLAAGGSRRFEGVKLAMPLPGGTTLLGRSFNALSQVRSSCDTQILPVQVCLGGHAKALMPLLPSDTAIIPSPAWQLGLGHSIAAVANAALGTDADALLLALADHALLSAEDYESLIQSWQESGKTTASWYLDAPGAPAIFNRADFDELTRLCGDRGAKGLLKSLQKQQQLGWMALPGASIDIDTRADFGRFVSTRSQ